MRLTAIVLVAAIGVAVTVFAAWRMWQTTRARGSRDLVLGYLALMLGASAVSVLLLRVL
jgi:hypothetical protein